jgi:hypothetical protein
MPYAEPKSYKESADMVLCLADLILAIKKTGGYSDEDARSVALTNCRLISLHAVMVLNVLTVGEQRRISGDDFRKLVGMTSGTAQDAADILEKTTRLGFVVLFQFQVENLLKNIYRAATGQEAPQGYYNVAHAFTQQLPDPPRKMDLLYLPALIRNSLHANGIHHGYNGQSTTIEIDGSRFEFKHKQKVSCAGWGHLAVAFNATLGVVEEILALPEVKALADPVMDRYAWEEATKPVKEKAPH